jgi:hypothetical protein
MPNNNCSETDTVTVRHTYRIIVVVTDIAKNAH